MTRWLKMEDILILSHHRKKTINRCRFKAYLHYDRRKRKVETDINLIFGTAFHTALDVYYNRKRKMEFDDLRQVFELAMDVPVPDDRSQLEQELSTWTKIGSQMLYNYHLITQANEHFEVLETERPFYLCLDEDGQIICDAVTSKENIPSNAFFILAGKIDLTIDMGGDIYFVDHKTTAFNKEKFEEHYRLDEQLLDYSIFGRWLYGERFKGTLVNGLNKKLDSPEGLIFRMWMMYSDEEIDYAISSYMDTAQEHYILRQQPHLLQQRTQDFDCNRCTYEPVSTALRKGDDWETVLELYYEDIEEMDWENEGV